MIVLAAEMTARPGKEAELERELRDLVAAGPSEPGTIMYALHRHRHDPRRFLVAERFTHREAWQAHNESPSHRHFVSIVDQLIEGRIEVYELLVEPEYPASRSSE